MFVCGNDDVWYAVSHPGLNFRVDRAIALSYRPPGTKHSKFMEYTLYSRLNDAQVTIKTLSTTGLQQHECFRASAYRLGGSYNLNIL